MERQVIEENVSLAPLTTFYLGGPARFFVRVTSVEELQEAVGFAKTQNLEILVLGGGSNMLIGDKGFDGLVIKIEIAEIEIQKAQGENRAVLIAGAGESWDGVVARAVGEGLWGIENLSGVPGTVGGAVVQNIGAYGAVVSEMLLWVEVFDTESGTVKRITRAECLFEYRESVFKHREQYIVTRAAFLLSSVPNPNLSYKDLVGRFVGNTPMLAEIRTAVLDIRRNKFPNLSVEGTAGSFFKNPILAPKEAEALVAQYPEMPLFSIPESSGAKVPLAWILDNVLGLKGFSLCGARLFEKQPLVVVAARGARARDVFALKEIVAQKVFDACGIKIEPEVKIISE